jgi:hypothetical protein
MPSGHPPSSFSLAAKRDSGTNAASAMVAPIPAIAFRRVILFCSFMIWFLGYNLPSDRPGIFYKGCAKVKGHECKGRLQNITMDGCGVGQVLLYHWRLV